MTGKKTFFCGWILSGFIASFLIHVQVSFRLVLVTSFEMSLHRNLHKKYVTSLHLVLDAHKFIWCKKNVAKTFLEKKDKINKA